MEAFTIEAMEASLQKRHHEWIDVVVQHLVVLRVGKQGGMAHCESSSEEIHEPPARREE